MPPEKSEAVSTILVEADLLGHTTHGLNLLSGYLDHIGTGALATIGEHSVVSERPACVTWEGNRLPGAWLVLKALDAAIKKAADYGMGTVVIRNSHHIGCLATYLKRATEEGMLVLLYSSAPAATTVAPFGGTRPVFSPSPMAMGCPTAGAPILVDISTSITTNNLVARLQREGRRLPGAWLLDHEGNATDDPAALLPPNWGSLLPLGGMEAGHKGYGLALMVEALTAGLSNHGRFDENAKASNTVFLQVFDPSAFGGLIGLQSQMEKIAQACRENPVRPGVDKVRIPGEKGVSLFEEQTKNGVRLAPGILESLAKWSAKLGVNIPEPI